MTITSFGRRARSTMALIAGAALLSLAACGTDAGGDAEDPSAAPASDGGTQVQSTDEPKSSDGGGADENQQEADQQTDSTGTEEGVTSASGGRTRILLRTELGVDGSPGEGALALAKDELAALLADPFGGTAECDDELVLEPDAASVGCFGPTSIDDTAPSQEWVANVVSVPSEAGFQNGSTVAVLFSTGTELPEEADDLLDEDIALTGVGFGSVFGMEPLSAEQVAESTLRTLTSEQAYVPVAEMAQWSDVTCEDGLDFAHFKTVECEAATAEGDTWELVVAPGTYADNDQGLLVGIDRTSSS